MEKFGPFYFDDEGGMFVRARPEIGEQIRAIPMDLLTANNPLLAKLRREHDQKTLAPRSKQ